MCGAALLPKSVDETIKLVTILFADVVGSTSQIESLSPDEAREFMSNVLAALTSEIVRAGGSVQEYLGDGIMSTFGHPAAREDDAVRAVRAGLACLDRTRNISGPRGSGQVELRVGINTGEVSAGGLLGGEVAIVGEAVHLAARLQTAAEPGEVVIGHRTAALIKGRFVLGPRKNLDLKGKSESVAAYVVAGEDAYAAPPAQAPLVGRERELEALRGWVGQGSSTTSPSTALVLGEPGIGKSRLLEELEQESTVTVFWTRCLPVGEGVTLEPFRELVARLARVHPDDETPQVLAKIEAFTATLDLERHAALRVREALNLTTGVSASGALLPPDPRGALRELQFAWTRVCEDVAQRGPHLLIVEDLHWADEASLAILEHLPHHVSGSLLLAATARSDRLFRRPWDPDHTNNIVINLGPLATADADRLAASLAARRGVSLENDGAVVERAGGNPFFLEELISRASDQQVRGGSSHTTPGYLPDTVQAAISARLDLLSEDERAVVREASVIGRSFATQTLRHLIPEVSVEPVLETLRERGLVGRREPIATEEAYVFRHELIRQVAYGSIPRRRRADIHARIASWLEERGLEQADDTSELLAYHFNSAFEITSQADLRSRARHYSLVASERAFRRFGVDAGTRFGERAIELSETLEERIEAMESLGSFLYLTLEGDAAWKTLVRAMDEIEAQGRPELGLARLAARAAIIPTRWALAMRNPPASMSVEEVLERGLSAVTTDANWERSQLLVALSFLKADVSLEEARLLAEQALDLAQQIDDATLMSIALDALNTTFPGRLGVTERIIDRRVQLADRIQDPTEIGDIFAMAAWNAACRGRFHDAVSYATRCIDEVRGLEAPSLLNGLVWRATSSFMTGDWSDALRDHAEIERLTQTASKLLPVPYSLMAYGVIAFCRQLRGEEDEAASLLHLLLHFHEEHDVSEDLWRRTGRHSFLARALIHRGDHAAARRVISLHSEDFRGLNLQSLCELVAASKDWAQAPEVIDAARRESRRGDLIALPLFADRLMGLTAAAADDREQAITALRASAEGFAALGAPWEAGYSQLLLAQEVQSDDPSSAAALAAEALTTFEALASVREISWARKIMRATERSRQS